MVRMPWYIKINFLILALFVVGMMIFQMNKKGLPPGFQAFLGMHPAQQVQQSTSRRRAVLINPKADRGQQQEKQAGNVDK